MGACQSQIKNKKYYRLRILRE